MCDAADEYIDKYLLARTELFHLLNSREEPDGYREYPSELCWEIFEEELIEAGFSRWDL